MAACFVIHESSEDWSALYQDGTLVTVGDHYLVQEKLLSLLGIETVQSNDFLRGGNTREGVARTLDELTAYTQEREAREAQAAALEAQASALRAQARALLTP